MNAAETPAPFCEALESLRGLRTPRDVTVREIEAPGHLAPYAAALNFTATLTNERPASAFLVVLYDPAGQAGWQGPFRLIGHVHGEVEPELGDDPLAAEVMWSWLHAALARAGAGYRASAGTVTCARSASFGDLRLHGRRTELELRASWSPATWDMGPHAEAIARLVAFVAGLIDPAEALGA